MAAPAPVRSNSLKMSGFIRSSLRISRLLHINHPSAMTPARSGGILNFSRGSQERQTGKGCGIKVLCNWDLSANPVLNS